MFKYVPPHTHTHTGNGHTPPPRMANTMPWQWHRNTRSVWTLLAADRPSLAKEKNEGRAASSPREVIGARHVDYDPFQAAPSLSQHSQ